MKKIFLAILLLSPVVVKSDQGDTWVPAIDENQGGRDTLRLDSSGNLLPGTAGIYNLGSSALPFNNLYLSGSQSVPTISATNGTFSGTLGVTGASTLGAVSATSLSGPLTGNVTGNLTGQILTASQATAITWSQTQTFSNGINTSTMSASGLISGQDETLSGTLNASGAAQVANLTSSSSTISNNESIGGTLTASSATVTNTLTASSATVTNTLTASSATVTNTLTASSATVTNTLTASSATVTNTLKAGAISGPLTGNVTGNLTGQILTSPQASAITWSATQTFNANSNFPSGIWNTSGNVGIGTTAPAYSLDVSSYARVQGTLEVGLSSITGNVNNPSAVCTASSVCHVLCPAGTTLVFISCADSISTSNALINIQSYADAGGSGDGAYCAYLLSTGNVTVVAHCARFGPN